MSSASFTPPAGRSVRVSVVVPAFDAEPFLATALASIAGQTVTCHEVIVVDDASTDATLDVARQWRGALPLSIHSNDTNLGLGATRGAGIGLATGDAIALLDADDCWLPDHLEHLLGLFRDDKTIVTPGVLRWTPGESLAKVPSTDLIEIPEADDQALEILDSNFLFAGSLFSRQAYEDAGGFRALRKNEDWDLWIRMVSNDCRVIGGTSPTVLYRQHSGSLSVDDGCLPYDIEMLEQLLTERTGEERRVIDQALRRRRAREFLVAAFGAAERGQNGQARRLFLSAAVKDRSFRGWTRSRSGSVTLRALPGLVRPGWAQQRRAARITSPDLDQAPGSRVIRSNGQAPSRKELINR